MNRSVNKCLNRTCSQVFLVKPLSIAERCPECRERNIGSVRRGDEQQWPFDEATVIARLVRGGDEAVPIIDTAKVEAA